MKPPQSYSFRSIYPRVRTKITPSDFGFIILDPTQRTSKSAPRFLSEKRRQERASTPMRRLPQCHRGNPRVECQNIYQVNQYDTPMSPRVFICKTYIKCSQIHKCIQSDNNEISKGKLNSSQQEREGKSPYNLILTKPTIHQDHDISRTWEREIKHIATSANPRPRGWITHSSSWRP